MNLQILNGRFRAGHFVAVFALIAAIGWVQPTQTHAEETAVPALKDFSADAAKTMRNLSDEGFRIIRDPKLGDEQKRKKLHDLMVDNVDVPSVIRFLFGRAIKTASKEQQTELTALISDFVINVYSVNLSNYAKNKINIIDARMDGQSAVVFSEIIRERDPTNPFKIVWRMVLVDNRPKLVDCIIEGISVTVTQRQEFASIMERSGKGMDGVIELLRERVDNFHDKARKK